MRPVQHWQKHWRENIFGWEWEGGPICQRHSRCHEYSLRIWSLKMRRSVMLHSRGIKTHSLRDGRGPSARRGDWYEPSSMTRHRQTGCCVDSHFHILSCLAWGTHNKIIDTSYLRAVCLVKVLLNKLLVSNQFLKKTRKFFQKWIGGKI